MRRELHDSTLAYRVTIATKFFFSRTSKLFSHNFIDVIVLDGGDSTV